MCPSSSKNKSTLLPGLLTAGNTGCVGTRSEGGVIADGPRGGPGSLTPPGGGGRRPGIAPSAFFRGRVFLFSFTF